MRKLIGAVGRLVAGPVGGLLVFKRSNNMTETIPTTQLKALTLTLRGHLVDTTQEMCYGASLT